MLICFSLHILMSTRILSLLRSLRNWFQDNATFNLTLRRGFVVIVSTFIVVKRSYIDCGFCAWRYSRTLLIMTYAKVRVLGMAAVLVFWIILNLNVVKNEVQSMLSFFALIFCSHADSWISHLPRFRLRSWILLTISVAKASRVWLRLRFCFINVVMEFLCLIVHLLTFHVSWWCHFHGSLNFLMRRARSFKLVSGILRNMLRTCLLSRSFLSVLFSVSLLNSFSDIILSRA